MPRPRNPVPSRTMYLNLPEDVRGRLDAALYSEVEEKVPFGAYQAFFVARINEWLTWRGLDLAPYVGAEPGLFVVRGEAHVLAALETALREGQRHAMAAHNQEVKT